MSAVVKEHWIVKEHSPQICGIHHLLKPIKAHMKHFFKDQYGRALNLRNSQKSTHFQRLNSYRICSILELNKKIIQKISKHLRTKEYTSDIKKKLHFDFDYRSDLNIHWKDEY